VKIIVDANLFASSLIKPNTNPGKILDLVKENQVELILSPGIIKEIKRILLYPKIQKYHRHVLMKAKQIISCLEIITCWT